MALNWAMLTPANSPIPLPQEEIVTAVDHGAELAIFIPDEPPSGSSTAGGSGGIKKLKETGGVWLTNQRLVFAVPATTSTSPNAASPSFTSLSVPLACILGTRFEQPYLGINYLLLELRPVAGGGLTSGTRVELRLKDHPMFSFVSTLEKVRERAMYMRRQSLEDDEGPPTYTSPAAECSTSLFVMATPAESPPGYGA